MPNDNNNTTSVNQLFAAKKDFIRDAYQSDKTLKQIKLILERDHGFPSLP